MDAQREQRRGRGEHGHATEIAAALARSKFRSERQRKSHHANTMQTKPFARLTNVNALSQSIHARLMRASRP
jgi:hypothetical protein